MLVWLPAPSLNLSGGGGGGALKQKAVAKFFASCPDNAFQVRHVFGITYLSSDMLQNMPCT